MFNKEKKLATGKDMKKLLCMQKEGGFNNKINKYVFSHVLLLHMYKIAIENNDVLAVKRLCAIEQMGKVIGYNDSISPLHYAARHGRAEIVDILIANGYHVNSKLSEEKLFTPLHCANTAGVVNCLARHGANIEAKSSSCRGYGTSLYLAVISGNCEVLEALYNNGAKVNFEDKSSALSAVVCSIPNSRMGNIIKFLCRVDCNPLMLNYLEWHVPITILITERNKHKTLEQHVSLDAVRTLFEHTIKYLQKDMPGIPNKKILEKKEDFMNLLSFSEKCLKLPELDRKVLKEFYMEHVYKNFLSFCLVDKRLCNILLGVEFKCIMKTNNVFELLPVETTRLIGTELIYTISGK